MRKSAILSDDGLYRYVLQRTWGPWDHKFVCWVMLNPSIADATVDDPTLRRCISYSKAWGFDGLSVVNAYGYRSPYPKNLWAVDDPIGHDNDKWVRCFASDAQLVVAAWGANIRPEREKEMVDLIAAAPRGYGERDLHCLGLTKDGHPKHPLRLAKDLTPTRYM